MKSVGPILIVLSIVSCSQSSPTTFHPQPRVYDFVSERTPEAPLVSAPKSCPSDMVEIGGDYCPQVEEKCLRWVGIHGQTVKGGGRCGEFQSPTKCLSKSRVPMHYCIDRYEFPNVEGQRPTSWMTFYDAQRNLKAENKRLCSVEEWTFACEGEDMQPYPYGDGYVRDKTACNFDNVIPVDPSTGKRIDVFNSKRPHDHTSQILDGMLAPAGSMPKCVSPWGVHEQIGNTDEWVNIVKSNRHSGLMGGHVFGVRSRCRAVTDGHGPTFGWYETNFRGCKDINH